MNDSIKWEPVAEYSFKLPLPDENEVRAMLEKDFGQSRTFTDTEVREITDGMHKKIIKIMLKPVEPPKEGNHNGQ